MKLHKDEAVCFHTFYSRVAVNTSGLKSCEGSRLSVEKVSYEVNTLGSVGCKSAHVCSEVGHVIMRA